MLTLFGGGSASAEPVSLEQTYTCKFPIISDDPIKIKINMDLPAAMKVGETVPAYDVNVTSTVSKRAAEGMGVLGGATLEGKATSDVNVGLPQGGSLPIKVNPAVPKTNIPDPPADFDIKDIKGKTPGGLLTWEKAGTAKFDVVGMTLKDMVVKDKDGKAIEQLNKFEAKCKLNEGQKTTIGTMKIEGGSGGSSGGDTGGSSGGDTGGSSGGDTGGNSGGDTGGDTGGSTGGDTGTGGSTGGDTGGDTAGTSGSPQSTGGSTTGGSSTQGVGTTVSSGSSGSGGGTGLAATGSTGLGLMLAAAGALGTAGIGMRHYLANRVKQDESAA